MASTYREEYNKEIFVFNKIIKNYHPLISELIKTEDKEILLDYMCKHNMFNIEYLLEQTVSFIGGIEQSGEYGEDFKDMSELKLVSLYKNKYGYSCKVRNLHRKKDKIRLIIFNKIKERLDYFIFNLSQIQFDRTKKHLTPYYSIISDTYSLINEYKVSSFEELCRVK